MVVLSFCAHAKQDIRLSRTGAQLEEYTVDILEYGEMPAMLDIVGMPIKDYIKKYGKPTRIERNEYGFYWYVYAKDYNKFLLVGVAGVTVVGAYSNSIYLSYRGIKQNAAKAAVRAILGTPLKYIRRDNLVHILNDADQKDYFEAGDKFIIVFYDILKGGGVTGILVVPKAAETRMLLDRPALDDKAVLCYQRISLDLVNAVRVRNGLKTLTADAKSTRLAVSRSKDMRDRNYFSHYTPEGKSPFDQARKLGIKFKHMGENISFGNHNAIFCHESFMNSAGHRAIILKAAYKKIGVGVAAGGDRYVLVAQEFTG